MKWNFINISIKNSLSNYFLSTKCHYFPVPSFHLLLSPYSQCCKLPRGKPKETTLIYLLVQVFCYHPVLLIIFTIHFMTVFDSVSSSFNRLVTMLNYLPRLCIITKQQKQ